MILHHFILLSIVAFRANAALICYRQSLNGRQLEHELNVTELFMEMEEYSCLDPRAIFCLEATGCKPTYFEEQLYKLENSSNVKYDIRDCLSPVIYYGSNAIKAENACEQYYQTVHGCQKCRFCTSDLCNRKLLPSKPARPKESENTRDKHSADDFAIGSHSGHLELK